MRQAAVVDIRGGAKGRREGRRRRSAFEVELAVDCSREIEAAAGRRIHLAALRCVKREF